MVAPGVCLSPRTGRLRPGPKPKDRYVSPLFLHSPHVSQVCSEHLGSRTSSGQEAGLSQHCCCRGSTGLEWPVSMSGGPCASPSSPSLRRLLLGNMITKKEKGRPGGLKSKVSSVNTPQLCDTHLPFSSLRARSWRWGDRGVSVRGRTLDPPQEITRGASAIRERRAWAPL